MQMMSLNIEATYLMESLRSVGSSAAKRCFYKPVKGPIKPLTSSMPSSGKHGENSLEQKTFEDVFSSR